MVAMCLQDCVEETMEERFRQLDMTVGQAPVGFIVLLIQCNFFEMSKFADNLMENGVVADIFSLVDDSQGSDIEKL